MANATSNFLQGANLSGAGMSTPPDENSVLLAISDPKINDMSSLANELGTNQQTVSPVVDGLLRSKLVEEDNGVLNLSSDGERAVRFAKIAKF